MGAEEFVPADVDDLAALRAAGAGCRGCALHEHASQTVFGEGAPGSRLMLVGEQPGDREDIEGVPFVGPAGRLLDESLTAAGIDRSTVYVTNAVKHFKWERRGAMRLHKKPSAREVAACRPWLLAEITAVRPEIVLCLGATAAQALLGPSFRVTRQRGQLHEGPGGVVTTATVHPSAILRAPDEGARQEELARFQADLRQVAATLSG